MVFLFRRFRKGKKDEPEAAPEESPSQPEPVAEPEPSPVEPVPAAEPEAPMAVSTPEPPISTPPPPLPTPAPVAASVTPASPAAECFLCGTPLEDHRCPKCQMTWIE